MGRGVRAVLGGFGALEVGRGGGCGGCKVCEGQRKGCIVMEVGGKYLLAAVVAALNLNLTLDLQLVLVWVLERFRCRCSGVRVN
jgi:hypothetical protein